jgi:hypothetical protein
MAPAFCAGSRVQAGRKEKPMPDVLSNAADERRRRFGRQTSASIRHNGFARMTVRSATRSTALACITAVILLVAAAPAGAESGPDDCTGIDFDRERPIVVAKVVAKPKAFYVKSAWEDAACPANSAGCQRKAYLVPGDLVLTGRQNGPFTCIAYESTKGKRANWTNGWMRSDSLAPVAPSRGRRLADWTGTWKHPMGEITIEEGEKGKLTIEGIQAYKGAQNVQTGVLGAEATPAGDLLAFADDGKTPFDQAKEAECQVRMQRVGKFLVVEDNGGCGGVMVTFTGFYQRKP